MQILRLKSASNYQLFNIIIKLLLKLQDCQKLLIIRKKKLELLNILISSNLNILISLLKEITTI